MCGVWSKILYKLKKMFPNTHNTYDIVDRRPNSYPETIFSPPLGLDIAESSANIRHSTLKRSCEVLQAFPKFSTEKVRLQSFEGWPKTVKQSPELLSRAGFFYKQMGDSVICFSCGGGLREWSEEDDPWEEHARWYSECDYLRMMKGYKFIEAVKDKWYKLSSSSSSFMDDERPNVEIGQEIFCRICSSEYNTAFFPCGHVGYEKCTSPASVCPVCRKPVEHVMSVNH